MHLEPRVASHLPAGEPFSQVMALRGDAIRAKEGRQTFRIELGRRRFFVKLHRGIGWQEIMGDLLRLRRPVLGAMNEYRAIQRLHEIGIDTMQVAGYGERGLNPARIESFLVTDSLEDTVTLRDLTVTWRDDPPIPLDKLHLLEKVAEVARCMHASGMNHRDFYLCHFRIKRNDVEHGVNKNPVLYLMDLHRAQMRAEVPTRWRVKDLGALYFSAADIGLTRRDILRFLRLYFGKPLKQCFAENGRLLARVDARARKFYRRDHKREMPDVFARLK